MPAAISVGDWIGDRFQVFDVHEGGMSLVYVVNDHLGNPGRRWSPSRPCAVSSCRAASGSAGLPRSAGSGPSSASIRTSCGPTRSRSSTAGRMWCSSWCRAATCIDGSARPGSTCRGRSGSAISSAWDWSMPCARGCTATATSSRATCWSPRTGPSRSRISGWRGSARKWSRSAPSCPTARSPGRAHRAPGDHLDRSPGSGHPRSERMDTRYRGARGSGRHHPGRAATVAGPPR